MTSHALLHSGGVDVSVSSPNASWRHALLAAAGHTRPMTTSGDPTAQASVRVVIEATGRSFPVAGFEPVTRGVWRGPTGEVVFADAGGSGFSQRWRVGAHGMDVHARWAPSPLERAAARLLTSRFRALRAQVLLHYPLVWWACVRGQAPLHVSVLEAGGVVILLAGPGGVGKSTLVARELDAGAKVTCDNLAVSDGTVAYGLSEPLRLPAELAAGRTGVKTTHGRREAGWPGRVRELRPEMVVVVRRGKAIGTTVTPIAPETARRALVAGTYAAGELRRFWSVAAMAGLATGVGPVHPPVEQVAAELTNRLPCFELALGATPGPRLTTMLREQIDAVCRREVRR
jgi:hypothetical protein